MTQSDILGALKSALLRGESLQKAMQSLYNSGYKKEEIEEAARVLQEVPQSTEEITKPKEPIEEKKESEKSTQTEIQKTKPQKPSKGKIFIIFLAIILFLLIAGLIFVLIFKEQVVEILNNLFN